MKQINKYNILKGLTAETLLKPPEDYGKISLFALLVISNGNLISYDIISAFSKKNILLEITNRIINCL